MNKRLVWLAPIALAVLLSGCRVTVQTLAYVAPSSLVGYSLMLENSARSGRAAAQETYHFKSTRKAFNAELDRAQSWYYQRDAHDTATVALSFAPPAFDVLTITCVLKFETGNKGTHECKYEEETTTMFGVITTESLSKGAFRIVAIGQS